RSGAPRNRSNPIPASPTTTGPTAWPRGSATSSGPARAAGVASLPSRDVAPAAATPGGPRLRPPSSTPHGRPPPEDPDGEPPRTGLQRRQPRLGAAARRPGPDLHVRTDGRDQHGARRVHHGRRL